MRSGSIHDDGILPGIRLFFMAIPSALRCPACGGRAVTGWGKVFLWLGGSVPCAECHAPVRGQRGHTFAIHGAVFAVLVILRAYGADMTWPGWIALALAIAVLVLWLHYGVRLISTRPVAVRAAPRADLHRPRSIRRAAYSAIALLLLTVVPTVIFVASFLVPPDAKPAWIGAALRGAAGYIFSWTMVRISFEREFDRRPRVPQSEV